MPDPDRGYRWGRFQGWCSVVTGLAFVLIGPWSSAERAFRFAMYATGIMQLVLGFGLLGKKQHGFVLFLVMAFLIAIGVLVGKPHIEAYVLVTAWWIVPAVFYYPKRRREFGFGKRSESQQEKIPIDYLKPMRELTDEERETVLGHIRGRTDKNC